MNTKKGIALRPLGNDYILIAEGIEAEDFRNMVTMNESAALLWKEVEGKEFDANTLVQILLDNYDISQEVAEHDAAVLLKKWKEAGVIE